MHDAIGWLATLVFSSSYLFRSPAALRRVQAAAALVWIAYGLLLHATPVIAANLIVAVAASASLLRNRAPSQQ
jgi:hypothetical protein